MGRNAMAVKLGICVRSLLGVASIIACLGWNAAPAQCEDVTIGVLNTTSTAPIYLAADRGYFEQQGINAKIVVFDSAQPVAVATVSGDLDFGTTGLTSAFFSLAGQGALKIVAG